ncbi:transmembrane protein 222-like [Pelomyxa schiedti]|nr:transmembrane protein 222-like [Pelomyxa schiedti]
MPAASDKNKAATSTKNKPNQKQPRRDPVSVSAKKSVDATATATAKANPNTTSRRTVPVKSDPIDMGDAPLPSVTAKQPPRPFVKKVVANPHLSREREAEALKKVQTHATKERKTTRPRAEGMDSTVHTPVDLCSHKWLVTSSFGGNRLRAPPIYSGDGKFLLVPESENILVYSVTTGFCVQRLVGHKSLVTAIVLHPTNPSQIFSSALDGTVYLWDFPKGAVIDTHRFSEGGVHSLFTRKHPETALLALVGNLHDSVSFVFEFPSGNLQAQPKLVQRLECGLPCRAAFRPDGALLAGISGISLWLHNLVSHTSLKFTHISQLTALHFVGKYLAVGDWTGKILLISAWPETPSSTQTKIASLNPVLLLWHSFKVTTLASDGVDLLSGGLEPVVVRWNLVTHLSSFTSKLGHGNELEHIVVSPTQAHHALVFSSNEIHILNAAAQTLLVTISELNLGWSASDAGLVRLSDTHVYALPSKRGYLQGVDVTKRQRIFHIPVAPPTQESTALEKISHVCFCDTREACYLVTIDERMSRLTNITEVYMKFWSVVNLIDFKLITRVDQPHKNTVTSLVSHPSEDIVITTSKDTRFKVWSTFVVKKPRLVTERGTVEEAKEVVRWRCVGEYFYKNYPVNGWAFFLPSTSFLLVSTSTQASLLDWLSLTPVRHYKMPISFCAVDRYQPLFALATSYNISPTLSEIISEEFQWNQRESDSWRSLSISASERAHVFDSKKYAELLSSTLMVFDARKPEAEAVLTVCPSITGLSFDSSKDSLSASRLIIATREPELITLERSAIQPSSAAKEMEDTLSDKPKTSDESSMEAERAAEVQAKIRFSQLFGAISKVRSNSEAAERETPLEQPTVLVAKQACADYLTMPTHALPPAHTAYAAIMDKLLRPTSTTNTTSSTTPTNPTEQNYTEPTSTSKPDKATYTVNPADFTDFFATLF